MTTREPSDPGIRRPEAEIQGVSEVAAVQRAVGRVPVPR